MRVCLTLFFFSTLIISCKDPKQEKGEEIYAKIKQYKKVNGHLPEHLSDVGIEESESGPIYYDRKSDSAFILWYGASLGESIVLDTITGEWKSDRQ